MPLLFASLHERSRRGWGRHQRSNRGDSFQSPSFLGALCEHLVVLRASEQRLTDLWVSHLFSPRPYFLRTIPPVIRSYLVWHLKIALPGVSRTLTAVSRTREDPKQMRRG
jgi:hypothetical protein